MKDCILYQIGQKSCCHRYRSLSSSMCAKHCRRCFRIACFSKNSSLGASKIGFWISRLFTINIFNIPFCDATSQVCGELLNICSSKKCPVLKSGISLIYNGGIWVIVATRDEFELEFSGSSKPELWRFRAELSRAGALQFSSWNRADKITFKFPNFGPVS